jgi:hypothetical protein
MRFSPTRSDYVASPHDSGLCGFTHNDFTWPHPHNSWIMWLTTRFLDSWLTHTVPGWLTHDLLISHDAYSGIYVGSPNIDSGFMCIHHTVPRLCGSPTIPDLWLTHTIPGLCVTYSFLVWLTTGSDSCGSPHDSWISFTHLPLIYVAHTTIPDLCHPHSSLSCVTHIGSDLCGSPTRFLIHVAHSHIESWM